MSTPGLSHLQSLIAYITQNVASNHKLEVGRQLAIKMWRWERLRLCFMPELTYLVFSFHWELDCQLLWVPHNKHIWRFRLPLRKLHMKEDGHNYNWVWTCRDAPGSTSRARVCQPWHHDSM